MKTAACICSMIWQALLLACLLFWANLAPLFWILGDGFAPGMVMGPHARGSAY